MQTFLSAWAMGLGTGLGLIVAIGAQNAFLLRLGISGPARAVLGCVAVCALSDLVLIAAGVAGMGVAIQRVPVLLVVFRIAGCLFLAGYGLLAGRRALRPSALRIDDEPAAADVVPERELVTADAGAANRPRPAAAGAPAVPRAAQPAAAGRHGATSIRAALLTCLAFTWLNPHVYIDTVIFIGSLANQQGPHLRWWWAAGAMSASVAWFTSLGLGARFLRPVFARPGAWRVLDACIAALMTGFAVRLALGV
jgi:L-lysine exporter family protein LysE/ArgO